MEEEPNYLVVFVKRKSKLYGGYYSLIIFRLNSERLMATEVVECRPKKLTSQFIRKTMTNSWRKPYLYYWTSGNGTELVDCHVSDIEETLGELLGESGTICYSYYVYP